MLQFRASHGLNTLKNSSIRVQRDSSLMQQDKCLNTPTDSGQEDIPTTKYTMYMVSSTQDRWIMAMLNIQAEDHSSTHHTFMQVHSTMLQPGQVTQADLMILWDIFRICPFVVIPTHHVIWIFQGKTQCTLLSFSPGHSFLLGETGITRGFSVRKEEIW